MNRPNDRHEELRRTMRLVEVLGLAPLLRLANSLPKTGRGNRYSDWNTRRLQVEAEAIRLLRDQGAVIMFDGNATQVKFGGVTASSTLGLRQALNNWTVGAERRLREK